jgi:hypothetical protein
MDLSGSVACARSSGLPKKQALQPVFKPGVKLCRGASLHNKARSKSARLTWRGATWIAFPNVSKPPETGWVARYFGMESDGGVLGRRVSALQCFWFGFGEPPNSGRPRYERRSFYRHEAVPSHLWYPADAWFSGNWGCYGTKHTNVRSVVQLG